MMYSSKPNVNILTSLLVAHGVRHAVVCPGSRNAPIVHNLDACQRIRCHPITDERSAGFQGLGLCQATGKPVVVCVTSGTALLNVAPAVAEAYYQHLPLVVVSADRPQQWIDQLDGQTMPQPDALGRFVRKAVSLPEPCNDEQQWYCNRLVNEALIAARRDGCGPVHINVPITPPLYDFGVPALPKERVIEFFSATTGPREGMSVVNYAKTLRLQLAKAVRPLIVIGQMKPEEMSDSIVKNLEGKGYVVLQEPLSGAVSDCVIDEMLLLASEADNLQPDYIVYVGGTLVSKRLKAYLRHCHAVCWRGDAEGEVADTFTNLRGVVQARPADVLETLPSQLNQRWLAYWQSLRKEVLERRCAYQPAYSSMLAVKMFEQRVHNGGRKAMVHYANSMSVRLACIYAQHYIYCNRGVNGIEGSLSTAAGFSLASDDNVYCVIGDLSFFYDRNALWGTNYLGNLRVLLLNNGGGGIFEKFADHLSDEVDADHVMARHHTSARGFCADNKIEYHCAVNTVGLDLGLSRLMQRHTSVPILLEVMTDAETDWAAYQQYFNFIKDNDPDQ